MFYKFEVGQSEAEATENICCVIGKDEIDHSTVTGLFQKFCSGYKSLDHQAISVYSENVLKSER